MKKKRIIAILCALVLASGPVWAVFKEDDLFHTLSVLLMELKENYARVIRLNGSAEKRIRDQHDKLIALIDECNELSVMLYSQSSANTFDITYALNEVTRQYEQFKGKSTPYATVKATLTGEMERYNRLLLTLRKMPPERTAEEIVQEKQIAVALDSVSLALSDTLVVDTPEFARDAFEIRMDDETIAIRDSCLYVAEQIVAYYWQQLQQIEKDNEYYEQTDEILRGAYDYAQEQYRNVQQKLFVEGQGNYFKTLSRIKSRSMRAWADIQSRYSLRNEYSEGRVASSWRGPIVFVYSFMLLLVLALATIVSTLVINFVVKNNRHEESAWFMEHKGMIIALGGLLLFGLFLFVNARTTDNTFIERSSRIMSEFALLVSAIFISMLIRLDRNKIKSTLLAYLPTLIMAFTVIYFRTIFIPNSVINLVFPTLLLLATVWQFWMDARHLSNADRGDRILLWASAGVMTVATLLSWAGVVMGSLLLIIWWTFQLALVESVTALSELTNRYYSGKMPELKKEYRRKNPLMPLSSKGGAFIEITWLEDLMKMTVLPLLAVWSFPSAIFLSCKVFNFSAIAKDFFFRSFALSGSDSEGGVQLSVFIVLIVLSLYFLFRYIAYASKASFRVLKTRSAVRKLGENVAFKETDINFNLANNIISLLVWGVYILIAFLLLKIPSSGLALISTGLATGIGFAMKDILNNFFYGVQLMGGKVRVGDVVECDGIRGTVVGLTYQTTQIEVIDGSILFFTNADLFNKNFKNLTRNHSYQLVTFTVGVKYGTDIDFAREVILEALQPLIATDKYGRELVDRKKGITVRLSGFGDSSVDLLVLLFTTVETYGSFPAQAREAIYNAFNEKGIEIPFPQRDVYIKESPKAE